LCACLIHIDNIWLYVLKEATIAVAAAEKKKREEKAIADVVTGTEAKTQKQAAKAMKPRARKSREITGMEKFSEELHSVVSAVRI